MAVPLLCACSSRPAKTIRNLQHVAASEQNAAIRYWAFSTQAREEGFRNIANLLEAIARSEQIHAERQRQLLSLYGEEAVAATDSVPRVGTTIENLRMSVRVEDFMARTVFPMFAAAAAAEGADRAEQSFRQITAVAVRHADYCCKALEKLETEGSDCNVVNSWSVCPQCGCAYKTASLHEACDLCDQAASSFILFQ